MDEFNELINILKRLLGPDGCPWDRVQTMHSIRSNLIEESSEVIDAINSEDNAHIKEELGDLFFVLALLCLLAEKEKRCTLSEIIQGANNKLVFRHPHVFGTGPKLEDSAQVLKQWNELKQQEKAHRKSVLDGIPKGLPALARAQKVYKKLKAAGFQEMPTESGEMSFQDEENLGNTLWKVVADAQKKGLDAEHALRKTLLKLEGTFRESESA